MSRMSTLRYRVVSPALEVRLNSVRICSNCTKDNMLTLFMSSLHLKSRKQTGNPPCGAQVSCSQPGEPGCDKTFRDERARQRHRAESCKHLNRHPTGYGCLCGRIVKRWAQFDKHRAQCGALSSRGSYCCCTCEMDFETFQMVQQHHNDYHRKRAGRPKKGTDKK